MSANEPRPSVVRRAWSGVVGLLERWAEWLGDHLTAREQLLIGIALVLLSVPLYFYCPFAGEPPVIYLMSAAAISLTGVTFVVGAEVLAAQEAQDREQGEQLRAIQADLAAIRELLAAREAGA